MPKVDPQARTNVPVYISLPPDLFREFEAMAGDGYGKRSELFRKMFTYYLGRIDNPSEMAYQQERARRLVAESRLNELRAAFVKVFQ
jgi:metal-responsive CopG/Arc/MetJ family transcriptional regulator